MSIYYSFGDFMEEVVQTAKTKVDLEKLFALRNLSTTELIVFIIRNLGWGGFVALVALLLLGPIAFGAAISAFLASPPGLILLAIFGGVTVPNLYKLYKNKELPIAIAQVGKEFQPKWRMIEGEQDEIDALVQEAADALIRKASYKQRKLFGLDNL